MDNKITYLNTDLDLNSRADLTALAGAFESMGFLLLHVTRDDDAVWYATFETDEQHFEPESNIAKMVTVIESLDEPHRSLWLGCTLREFNIGYDCGAEPWSFNQALSAELLGRIAAVGAALRITLYADRPVEAPGGR